MYPIVAVVVILWLSCWRSKIHNRERQQALHTWRWPWLLQPYFLFTLLLLVYCVWQTWAFIELAVSYEGLNKRAFVRPHTNRTAEETELNDYELLGWLSVLCKLGPAFVIITFGITAFHLWLHIPPAPNLRWFPTYSHDLAMQVVCLPLVYGLFALDNIVTMLDIFTGRNYSKMLGGRSDQDQFKVWKLSASVNEQAYNTNFELADLYEAWALQCFGLLCFTLVRRQVLLEAPTVEYLLNEVEQYLTTTDESNPDLKKLGELTLLKKPEKMLFAPLEQTSNLGIKVFVWTYAAKSAYSLLLTVLAEPPLNLEICGGNGLFPSACSVDSYAEGAAMLASTLAILNIVVFEHNLKPILNKQKRFRAVMKFMAVKVLVSIVFFQSFILSVVCGTAFNMSRPQTNLCYSCLICFEVLPLSILVLYAWRPKVGDWHEGDQYCHDGGELDVEFAGEKTGAHMSSESFIASRKPQTSMKDSITFSEEISAWVELRGDVRAGDGRALVQAIEALSTDWDSGRARISARYKPAALFQDFRRMPTARSSTPGGIDDNSLDAPLNRSSGLFDTQGRVLRGTPAQ